MELNVFLFFPETEDQVLNDLSKKILTDSLLIIDLIKKQRPEIKIFYDSENISSFFNLNIITEVYLDKDINKLRIKLNKNKGINIQDTSIIDTSFNYFQWIYDTLKIDYCVEILKEIIERKTRFTTEDYVLINFNNSLDNCRERILAFRDGKHIKTLPVNFVHVEFVNDFLEFEIWLKTNHIKEFSLFDRNNFLKTSSVYHGKPIFKEKGTGYFWYLDNFHKDEYEVFNSNKEHIGVADLNGNLDIKKKITGRTFN